MSGFKIPSRNKIIIDENPTEVTCPCCGNTQQVTNDNTEIFCHTKTYWCESCGEQFLPIMRNFEYKYSVRCKTRNKNIK